MQADLANRAPRRSDADRFGRAQVQLDGVGARRPPGEPYVALSLRERALLWLALQGLCLIAQAAEFRFRGRARPSQRREVHRQHETCRYCGR